MSDQAVCSYDIVDDQITASIGGKVIASGTDLAEVEQRVASILNPPKVVTGSEATHIVSPNGVRGKIISRTSALWGDAYTVRFENNEIQTLYASDSTEFAVEAPKKTASGETPITRLTRVIEASPGSGKAALKKRYNELVDARTAASQLIANGASLADSNKLNEIVVQAQNEQREIKEALEHIDATEGEGIEPYRPEMQIIPGENVGHQNDGTWLDAVLEEDKTAAESVDFEKLLDDGPTLFVAEQDDATLADTGDTRERALAHVQARTAGLDGDKVEEFERLFLARTEQARRIEYANRKQTTKEETVQKSAHVENAPVESLFM